LYTVQSLSISDSTKADTAADTPTKKSPVKAKVTTSKGKKQKSKHTIKTLVKTSRKSQGEKFLKLSNTNKVIILGGRYGVTTDRESNTVRDITIDSMPYEFKNLDIDTPYLGLLYRLLQGRSFIKSSSSSSSNSESAGCEPQDIYVNYIYEYDIQNQVFNSSFQDPESVVVQRLQSDIAYWTAEEIFKRNLSPHITDEARLTKIVDVSKQNKNQAAIRLYVSISVSKSSIPAMRRVFETVFTRLQRERFATSNKKVDWGNMVLIPITK
jgi:hypothetical protein